MQVPLNGAIIGCGAIAPLQLKAWAEVSEARIIAVCDTDLNRAIALGKAYGVQQAFASTAGLFSSLGDTLDFIDIATPPSSHHAIVAEALQHKLHVLCQKPIAEGPTETEALVKLAGNVSQVTAVNEIWKWLPGYRKAWELLSARTLGDIDHVRFTSAGDFMTSLMTNPQLAGLRQRLAVMPNLILFEYGVHILDMFRSFFGEPNSVYASTSRISNLMKGEDGAYVKLTYDNFAADIALDWCASPNAMDDVLTRDCLSIRTRLGQLQVVGGRVVTWVPNEGAARTWRFEGEMRHDGFCGSQGDFIRAILDNREPSTSMADNLKTINLVFACYESSRTNEMVRLAA